MRVGFTGTRKGMTLTQWMTVQDIMDQLFEENVVNEWHDGDCIGADDQAHGSARILRKDRGYNISLVGHPCNLSKMRAYNEFDRECDIKPPLVRNRDIVNETTIMLAAPHEYTEVKIGSGTWATIRHAKEKRNLVIVWPDGSTERHVASPSLLD